MCACRPGRSDTPAGRMPTDTLDVKCSFWDRQGEVRGGIDRLDTLLSEGDRHALVPDLRRRRWQKHGVPRTKDLASLPPDRSDPHDS